MKTHINDDFVNKFRLKDLLIKQTGSWIISLRPQQPTLGSLVLTLNRNSKTLAELSEQEGRELSYAFKDVEAILRKTLNPDKINYLSLMMVDNQVHFHVIPRFKENRSFNDVVFVDDAWPKPPVLDPLEIREEDLHQLLQFLKSKSL